MDQGGGPTRAMSFGHYLRRQRERRHLTLETAEALSSKFGDRISKASLSRLENSRTSPNLQTLGTLSLLYDVPLSEMVERYEIDRRLHLAMISIEGKQPAEIIQEAIANIKAGTYLDALALARATRERIESGGNGSSLSGTKSECHRLHLIEAECLLHLGFHESAKVDAERILTIEDLNLEDRLIAWHCLVACCLWLERFQVAEAALSHAECLLELPGAPARFHADIPFLRGNMLFKSGQYDQALAAYSSALKVFESLSKPHEVCRCRVLLGGTLVELGKYRHAREQLEQALSIADSSGYARLKCLALSNLTKLTFRLGHHSESEGFAVRSNRLARPLEYDTVIFRNTWYLHEIAIARGDERAAKSFERPLLMYLTRMPDSMPEAQECRNALRSRQGGGA
jgi:tetratricopeptide (TPR) repeat protein